jgi:hypothetical protein
MKKFAFAVVVIFALLVVPALAATDITGKWSGSFNITTSDGDKKEDSAHMELTQKGTELTGTAGPNPDKQYTILKGKVEGNKVTFELQADETVIKFNLMLVDGHLKGEANAAKDDKTMKAALDLQRIAK